MALEQFYKAWDDFCVALADLTRRTAEEEHARWLSTPVLCAGCGELKPIGGGRYFKIYCADCMKGGDRGSKN